MRKNLKKKKINHYGQIRTRKSREREQFDLREQLKFKEKERDMVWEDYWFLCWILLPLIGWIIIVITVIQGMNKVSRLERECREFREQIHELERKKYNH